MLLENEVEFPVCIGRIRLDSRGGMKIFAALLIPVLLGIAPASAVEAVPPDAEVMKTGKVQFMICAACHGQTGAGTAAAPPLAKSEWVNGPVENLIRIQLRGLVGPIPVKGEMREYAGGMAPLAYQSDDQIAAVLTYVRNSFGNSAPAVTAEQVKALRSEVGKPQLTLADLAMPEGLVMPGSTTTPAAPSKVYDDLKPSGFPKWIIAAAIVLLGALVWFLKRKG
ncbi:MAG: cytochrome c [Akkermansiaceae bacterium]|nr:cytochrome c [Akkermansiaceae bacterium]